MTRTPWACLAEWLIALALPVLLLTTDVRVVTSHWFVSWEYGHADFPPDPYGLSAAKRTRLAEVCADYLATNGDISLLANLRLPDAEPAFNERELRHMADVQLVYHRTLIAGTAAALILFAGMTALLVAPHTRRRIPAALLSGSLLTLGLLGGIGLFMVLSWAEFFTTFHHLFFEGESWVFPYSDTLIRLFPIRFWIDVAAVIAGLMGVETAAIGAAGWFWGRQARLQLTAEESGT